MLWTRNDECNDHCEISRDCNGRSNDTRRLSTSGYEWHNGIIPTKRWYDSKSPG